jgi:uncharacterized protein (DUF697 family)
VPQGLPIEPTAVFRLVRELRSAGEDGRVLAVGGARELVPVLRRELGRGAAPGAVADDRSLDRAAVLVYVLGGRVTEEDDERLKAASVARVPIVAVLTGPLGDGAVPHVLATDVVEVPPGSGFPLDEIAEAVARRLGEHGVGLAARIPVLRRAVCAWLIARASRRNALIGAVVIIPGADFPALTLNQLRLVLHIAAAHGLPIDRERVPEVVGVLVSGLGLRALARRLLSSIRAGRWVIRGGFGYAGTRAVGEAALRLYEARAPGAEPEPTPQPASASPAAS